MKSSKDFGGKMIKSSLDQFLKLPKNTLSGKTICFITDTVWGVGVMVDSNVEVGINKIYKLKQRDENKPIAVLVSNVDDALKHVEITSKDIYNLVKLWPGALTLIFKKSDDFYDGVTKFDTIGIRVPDSNVSKKLLDFLGPVATTSVNISGSESLNSIEDIEKNFHDKIDYLITDTNPLSKVSSTVVDVTSDTIKVLRLGSIKINV